MANDDPYKGLSLKGLSEPVEPVQAEAPSMQEQEDPFAGLSFSDLNVEEPSLQEPVVQEQADPFASLSMADLQPPEEREVLQPEYAFTSADFDLDEDGMLSFLFNDAGKAFTSALVRGGAAIGIDVGRRVDELSDIEKLAKVEKGEGDVFDYLDTLSLINPIRAFSILNQEVGEKGREIEKQNVGVYKEASKDLEEIAEKVEGNLGQEVLFSAASSMGAAAPAVASAPLRSPMLTLSAMGLGTYATTTQEAVEAGESLTKARVAGTIDGLIESGTEALPIMTLFKLGRGKSLIKDAMKFLAQEEGSELAATALQSANAKLMYNQEMTTEEFLDDMLMTALSTPISAGVQAGGMTALNKGIEKAHEKIRSATSGTVRGESEEVVSDPAKPYQEEVIKKAQAVDEGETELMKVSAQLEEVMQEIALEAKDAPTEEQGEAAASTFPLQDDKWLATHGSNSAEAAREVAEIVGPVKVNGKERDVTEISAGEVATAVSPRGVENARKMMEVAEGSSLSAADKATVKRSLDKARKDFQTRTASTNKAQKVLKSWVEKYAPDMKLVVSFGTEMAIGHGANLASDPLGLSIIQINPVSLANRTTELGKVPELREDWGYTIPNATPEVLAHEFGHALVAKKFAEQPEDVRQIIMNDYVRYLGDMTKVKYGEVGAMVQPMAAATSDPQGGMRDGKSVYEMHKESMARAGTPKALFTYGVSSFREFLAQRMARLEGAGETTREFYSSARNTLRDYYKGEVKVGNYDKGFDLFLRKLGAEAKLERVRADYGRRVRALRDAETALQRAATTPATTAFMGGVNGIVPPVENGGWGPRNARFERINSSVDKWNQIVNLTAGLTHISSMNSHIPGVPEYSAAAQQLWRDKMRWTERSSKVLREWMSGDFVKGSEARQRFSDFLFEADARSEKKGYKLNAEEMGQLRQEYGITEEMYAMAERVWGTFSEALIEVEESVVADLVKNLVEGDTVAISKMIQEVRNDFGQMRNRNYMPHSRFGSYTVTGYASRAFNDSEGRTFKKGSTTFFGTYVTEGEAIAAKKKLEKEAKGRANYGIGVVEDAVRELIDMPPALAKLLESKLSLTAEQQKQLNDVRAILAPGQSFRKRFVERENIPGYSTDSLRVFADYMQKFSGHLARIKNVPMMEDALEQMKGSSQMLRQKGGNTVKREKITGWYQEHLEYMLNPGNELSSIRAVGFLWYLGFNPKSAIINSTQIPLITYPYLAQQYNDVSAAAAISAATYQMTKAQFSKKGMDPDLVQMTDELVKRGIIDESMATELAALAEGGFLARAPGKLGSKLGLSTPENAMRMQRFFEWGAFMFQTMEKVNRRITAAAAYKLARKAGNTHEQAVDVAHEAVLQTQYEYSRINRPKMMRGKLGSNVFMFWQYITNTLWFMGQNKGAAARYMLIMFALVGLEGLPFGSNILDLLDYATKKLKETAGWKDPKAGARAYLQEAVKLLDDNPMMPDVVNTHQVMNGASEGMFGMFDLSASLGMGQIVPGTEYLATDMNPQTEVLGTAQSMAGAMVNIPLSITGAVFSDKPDTWKTTEAALPSAAKSLSAAIRLASRGQETDSRGAEVAEFNWPDDPQSWGELVGRGTGMSLTRVNREREKRFASYDAIQYYSKRHTALTSMLNYAYAANDMERASEALDRIAEFNKIVPFPEMQIQSQSIVQSLKAGQKSRMMREAGFVDQKKYIRLQKDTEGRYD